MNENINQIFNTSLKPLNNHRIRLHNEFNVYIAVSVRYVHVHTILRTIWPIENFVVESVSNNCPVCNPFEETSPPSSFCLNFGCDSHSLVNFKQNNVFRVCTYFECVIFWLSAKFEFYEPQMSACANHQSTKFRISWFRRFQLAFNLAILCCPIQLEINVNLTRNSLVRQVSHFSIKTLRFELFLY